MFENVNELKSNSNNALEDLENIIKSSVNAVQLKVTTDNITEEAPKVLKKRGRKKKE